MPSERRNTKSQKISILRRKILQWFVHAGRDLPWRKTSDPYAILVSEIMLQQTQVRRVIPKYHAFLKRFSNWQDLAGAPQSEVVKMWAGLGYNRRALGLHKLAKAVAECGELPSDPKLMQALPGIGPYTAQAVAAFAFRKKGAAPVDTNIERILKRVFNAYALNAKQVAQLAAEIVPADVWSWNHALMDFGATMCTAKAPKCEECPLKSVCGVYPCAGGEIKKIKQSAFNGSDRYYRGKLISFLRRTNILRRNKVGGKIGLRNKRRVEAIIAGLLKDQLITDKGGKLSLVE